MPALDPKRMKLLADYLAQLSTCLADANKHHLQAVEGKLHEIVDDLHLAADGSHAALGRLRQESKR